jgi:CPA2 family monovalent cation:H+ antiporter-2
MAIDPTLVVQDLAVVMVIALGVALVFYLLRLPVLVGFIIAGIIIGPYTPPAYLLHYPDVLNSLAEIGIVFLLFGVGLEYPISKLRSVGRTATVIASAESLGTFAVGALLGRVFGLGVIDCLFLGLAVSVTSTVTLSRLLEEMGVLHDSEAGLILWITVIEDVIVVSALGILQSAATTGSIPLTSTAIAVGVVVLFLAVVLVVGPRVVPAYVRSLARTGRGDLFIIGILALAFGLSIVSSLIGVSVATGALLAGVLIAESDYSERARGLMIPLRDVFGAIFFVSIGALMDIDLLPNYLLPIVVIILGIIGAKLVLTYLAALSQKVDGPQAWRTALTMSTARGELSLAIAQAGAESGATSPVVLPLVGVIVLVTSLVSPFVVRHAWRDRFVTPPPPTATIGPTLDGSMS